MKTKYRDFMKRSLALFLCLVMMLGNFPGAMAAGEDSAAPAESSEPAATQPAAQESAPSTPEGGAAAAPSGDEQPTGDEPSPAADPEGGDDTGLHPSLSVGKSSNGDAEATQAADKLSFTALPSYTLPEGEELPAGATVEYAYTWQYAERKFTSNWWGSSTEQNLSESDWKPCDVADAVEGEYYPFDNDGVEISSITAEGGGAAIGQEMKVAVPAGVDRRTALSNMTVRCVVSMTIKDSTGNVIATAQNKSSRTNISLDSSLLACTVNVDTTGTITDLNGPDDVLTYVVTPSVENAPVDGSVSYSYTWQYKDGSRWRAINYSSSPIKNAVTTDSATGSTLTFPLPELIPDRAKLEDLEVRCKVTANAGGYTVSESPKTESFAKVTVAPALLTYSFTVESDNSGGEIKSADDYLRFKVTPKLSGAGDSFSRYSYNWQYLRADDPETEADESGWVTISRSDAACPFKNSTATSGRESTLSMRMPDDLTERAALNGQKVRCVVTVTDGSISVDPSTVTGEEGSVSIPQELLSACTLAVEADVSNNSHVEYPGQVLRWMYVPTVGGANPEDTILVYNWTFNGRPIEQVSQLNGFEYITDADSRKIGVVFGNTTQSDILSYINNGTMKCDILLYANQDSYNNNHPEFNWCESHSNTISTVTVKDSLAASYTKRPWLTDAWLNVNTDVKSDAIVNVGDEAIVEIIFDLGSTRNLTPDQEMIEDQYVANMDRNYGPEVLIYTWEYRENENQPWKPISNLGSDLVGDGKCVEVIKFEGDNNIGKTGLKVSITADTDYAKRNQLSGMQFRCSASALVRADEPDPDTPNTVLQTPWGVVSASVPDNQVLTVIINPKLLRSQVSSTRRIIGFLNADDAAEYLALDDSQKESYDAASKLGSLYDSSKSYQVKYFADGVREDRAKSEFPTSIVAVYEYQELVPGTLDQARTKTAAVEIPVPWRFIVQNGRQYDFAATKAEYRYDAVLADIIPQWNDEALQEYINSHDPESLDYDEDAATKWVVAASLNGRFPHIKVCWNTELMAFASDADYKNYKAKYGEGTDEEGLKVKALAGSPVNPYTKDTYSDWFFKYASNQLTAEQQAEAKNEPSTEAEQLAWLNAHYSTVKVMMEDVRSDLSDPTPIVLELPITWKKVEVNEYDVDSQSMSSRWLGDEAVGVIQGVSAAAAKWGWQASIDAVENGEYVPSSTLRNNPAEASIYWSNVIDGIVGAVTTDNVKETPTTYRALSSAAAISSNILPYLRVELKDANGGLNIQDVIPIDAANWKIVEGSVCEADTAAPRGYSWRGLDPDAASIPGEVGTSAKAGFVTIEPILTGYTFTENADPAEARVAYQWGTIITELMKSDGVSPYDPLMAAKTPIQIVPQIGGNDQTQAQWAKISTKLSKSFKTTIMDVSKTSGSSTSTAAATWTKPNYNESTPAGKIQPVVKIDNYAGGIVFGEDFLRDLGIRDIYGEASWKIAVPSVNSGSSSFIKWNSDSGQPYVSGASGQKTVYADRPWECYYSTNTTGAVRQQTANFAPGAQDTWQSSANGDGVKYMVTTSSRGGGAYVEWSVTFRNDSTGVRYVGLSYGSDVMIHSNDRAPLTKTETGFKMEEAQGDNCQFNINCTTATAGISVSADTRWIGVYSSRQHWTEAGGNYVSGIDSGLTFSWIPSKHPLQPGEQVTFTCQFGIGKMSDPPRIVPHYDSGSGRSTDVTMSGSKLNVSAWLAGDNKYPMTLYYILDEGLPTQQSEASVGGKQTPGGVVSNATFAGYSAAQKETYFRGSTGNAHFKQFTGQIEKPRDWVAGEYHTITLFGLSDAGLMTDSVRFPLYVTENEDGEEVFVPPTSATVSFTRGAATSGTPPAAQSAHLQEPITLPKGTGMSYSGYKFVGWEYQKPIKSVDEDGNVTTTRKSVTYPAESYFYVLEHPTTLTARWIPNNQTMYLVEVYVQNSDGTYAQSDTEVQIAPVGSGNIVYTPEAKPGYNVNTSKSKLSVARADGSVVKVYYDINRYNVVYNVNDAPTVTDNGDGTQTVKAYNVFRTVQVPYGGNVSGVPNAAQLNAGKNNNFFTFRGWFTNPDVNNPGTVIDTDTIVDETTLKDASGNPSVALGATVNAYSHWRPNGSAQVTFDYAYVNHAQGASRSDKVKLDPVVSDAGKYGYGAKPVKMPRTPTAWKDTSGKVFTFKEWRIVDASASPKPADQWEVFTRDTVLPNYENVTVRAFWEESYTVSRSTQGDGTVWDINDPAGGEKSYAPGDSVDIRWRANPGSYVQHVYIDNVLSDELIKNGGWHLDDIGGQNHSVYVVFDVGDGDSGLVEETTYNITATPVGGVAFTRPPRGGTYKASFGENYTVKWNLSPGYEIASVTVNGLPMDVSEGSDIRESNEYQFNDIHTDQEIVVTAIRSDGTGAGGGSVLNRGPYTISTKIAKGTSITPNHTVNYGGSSTVSWRLPYGFVVDRVYVNNVQLASVPEDNSYTFRNVAMNSSIQVVCKPDPTLPEDTIYVSTTIDDHGTITPTTPIGLLSKGDDHTVTWSVDSGWYVYGVLIDNVVQKTADGANKIFYSYTFENIQEPHDVVVVLRQAPVTGENMYTVSTSMVNGGTIDSPGAVPSGSAVTVTWRMAANHHVTGVFLDGEPVADYDLTAQPSSYTISNISANHSLRVECERDAAEEVPDGHFTVTTSINLGAADGRKIVASGDPCTVNWTPPRGYHLESVKVNGVAVSGVSGNSYTIPSVTQNTTVEVKVAKDDNVYTVNASIINGGTVSGSGDYGLSVKAGINWTVASGFRVTKVTLDGTELTGIDLANDRSYTFTPPADAKGKTYNFVVECAPELYYSVRTVGVGCTDLSASKSNILLGSSYTVTWKAAAGYRFKEASVNDTAITPTEAGGVYSYTFDSSNTAAGKTYTLKAICEKIPAYTITTGRNSGGTVSPSKTIYDTDSEKTYTVTWSAANGYRVKSVTINGDPYTGENYVFDYANGRDDNLRVEFEPQSFYTVQVTGQNASINQGSGVYSIDDDAVIKWTAPGDGFHITGLTINGTNVVGTLPEGATEYTFDHSTAVSGRTYQIVVSYAPDTTGGGDEPETPEFYNIDTDGIFTGSITPDGQARLGEDYTVNWTVASGYALKTVAVDGVNLNASDYVRNADGSYTYVVAGAGRVKDQTVRVVVTCDRDSSGGEAYTPYSVYGRSNDAAMGTVTPSSATLREPGASATVRWTPKSGCHVDKVTISEYSATAPNNRVNSVDLSEAEAAAGQYVFNYDEHKDIVVDVEFAQDPEYTVSVLAAGNVGEGCTVTANGGTAPVTLGSAADVCNVAWNAAAGYTISAIEVLSGATVVDTLSGSSKSFAYGDLSGDITVRVTFTKDPTQPPYSVHASVNDTSMGTVTPAVKNLSVEGSTCDITWAANPGYRVRSVVISDYPSGANARQLSASEARSGVYTFKYDDGKDINIRVNLEALTPYEVTVKALNGGASSTVTGGGTLNIAGQTAMVLWSAGSGYSVQSVVISKPDGSDAVTLSAEDAAKNSYLFKYDEMNDDRLVTVTFQKDPAVVSVVTSVNDPAMGWISPSADLYTAGSEYQINWGANDGYEVRSVVITPPLTPPFDFNNNSSYTFKYDEHVSDTAATTVLVNFAPLPEYDIITQKIGGGVNSSVRDGATLTRHGETYAVTWTADAGFEVESAVITKVTDGTVYKTLTAAEIATGKYTFSYDDIKLNVNDDLKLTVTFTTSDSGNGTIPYDLTTSVNDTAMGSIDPGTTLRLPGSQYVVTWAANPGYTVDKVYVSDKTHSLTEEYTGSSYTFKYDDGADAAVRVVFKEIPKYTLTTVIQGNGGANSTVSDGAVLAQGQSHTVTWHADTGYIVKSVVISLPDGTDRTELTAEQIALGSYTMSYNDMGESDRKLTVTFQKDENTTPGGDDPTPYTVTTSVNDPSMGSVSPSKTLRTAGETYEITWTANPGYRIKLVSVDGRVYNYTLNSSFTFKYDDYKDSTVKVTFAPIEKYNVFGAKVGGGADSTVSGGGILSKSGDTATVTWTAGAGYEVSSVVVTNDKGRVVNNAGPEEIAAGAFTISYDDMTSDQTVTVTFTKQDSTQPPYSINTSVNDASMGWVDPSVTLRTPGSAVINWGANPGYRVKNVTVSDPDGTNSVRITDVPDGTAKPTSYTFSYVAGGSDNKDQALVVNFEKIPEYTVTAEKIGGGANSSVAPASGTLADSGDTHIVSWTADTGYLVSKAQIFRANNSLYKTLSAAELAAGSYTFKYDEMPGDLKIVVTFNKDMPYSVSVGAVGSGTIKIDGDASLSTKTLNTSGQTAKVTWSAAEGWHFKSVSVNGTEISPDRDGEYTFKYDSFRDERVVVTFEENDKRVAATALVASTAGGSVGLSTISDGTTMNIPGATHTVNWTVDPGYDVQSIVITGADGSTVATLDNTATSHTFKYDEMTGDQTLTVTLEKKPDNYTITTGINDAAMGSISAGATLSASGTHPVTWAAKDGYHIKKVTYKVDGVEDTTVDLSSGSYTFDYDEHHDVDIFVEFERNSGKAINVNVSGNGTASLPTILRSGSYNVSWSANEGSLIDSVTVSYGDAGPSVTLTEAELAAGSYLFRYEDMPGDATVNISFKEKDYYYISVSGQNVQSITATPDKIDCTAPVDSQITWEPVDGAVLTGFTVDDVPYQMTDPDAEHYIAPGARSFTFEKLEGQTGGSHTVSVVYTLPEPEPTTYRVNVIPHFTDTCTPSADVALADIYNVAWTVLAGYEFKRVTVNGNEQTLAEGASGISVSNADAENGVVTVEIFCERQEPVNPDEPQSYTVTANKSGSGTVSIDGDNTLSAKTLNNAGETATVTWAADEGYRVKTVKIGGTASAEALAAGSYEFKYDDGEDTEVFVEFEALPEYMINVTKSGSGSAEGAGVMRYNDADRLVTWTAAEGWHIEKVTVDGVKLPDVLAQQGRYTVRYADLNADKNIVVSFVRDEIVVAPSSGYTVSTEYEGSGSISNGTTLTDEDGDYVHTVTWAPAEGWRVKSAELYKTEDGSLIRDLRADGKYDFSYAVGMSVTVKVVFEKDEQKQFNIVVSVDNGGTLSSDASATLTQSGDSFTARWTVGDGYHLTGVELNGSALDAGDYTGNKYDFDYDDMLAANMPEDNLLEIKLEEDEPAKNQYLISTQITPTGSGSISPSAIVEEGDSATVTWTVGDAYVLKSVTVDGSEITLNAGDSSYTFDNVTANHSVVVTCEEKPPIIAGDEFFDIVSGISNGAMSDGKTIRSIHKDEDYTLSWTPNPGFFVESVSVDGVNKGAITSWTFTSIDRDHTIEVVCKSLAESDLYYVNVSVVDADGNPGTGAVTSGNRELTVGTAHTVTWSALSGYEITDVVITDKTGAELVNYSGAQVNVGKYEIAADAAHKDDQFNVKVVTQPKDDATYFNIAISSMNATITGKTRVKAGETTTISWEPEFGYEIKSIVIDDSARPTTLESYTFENVSANHSVTVICQRLDSDSEYVITTHITDGGTITAPVTVKTAEEKASQTITWAAPEGFRVARVKVDAAIRNDLLTAGSVSFTNINSDHSVEVECEAIPNDSYTITVSNDNGTISAQPATVQKGDSSVVTWKPADGFKLDSVVVDGTSLDRSDYTKNADGTYSYSFSNVTADHEVSVNCVLENSAVNYAVSTSITNGTITESFTVAKGDTAPKSVSWTVADGYRVVSVLVDGSERADLKTASSVNLGAVNANRSVSVQCERIPTYTIRTDGVNVAAITPTGTVTEGDSATVTWTPAEGMTLKSIFVDSVQISLSDCTANDDGTYSYAFVDVRSDHSVKVSYEPQTVEEEYLISTHISDGGTITAPITVKTPAEKSSQTVTWSAPEGFKVKAVKIDGNLYPELVNASSYTFVDIIANHSFDVECERIPEPVQHSISVRNDVGMITASPATVPDGGESTVTWSGMDGFSLDSVTVDGRTLEESEYTANADGTFTYKFVNVTEDHSLVVNYVRDQDPDNPDDPDNAKYYIFTHIDNGTITPTVTVTTEEEKASQTIEWTVAEGYSITQVLIDGTAVAEPDAVGGSYEFTDIQGDHSVTVSCEQTPLYTIRTDGVNVKSITPTNSSIAKGDSFTVTWEPADGMVLKAFRVDNKDVTPADGNSYTFEDVKANHRVYVEYGLDQQEPEQPEKVEISVMVTNGVKTGGGILRYGTASHTITWAPSSSEFVVKSVTIDNVPLSESQLQPNGGSYTFTNIVADHTVVVVCEKEESSEPRKLYLEANIINGMFDPDNEFGVYELNMGDNFELSWAPNDGYKVIRVEVDGRSRPDLITAGKLSLIGVRSDHTLTVECRDESVDPVDPEGPFTVTTAIGNGTISPSFTTTDEQNYYTVTWAPAEGYKVVNVLVDGNEYAGKDDGYITFNPITSNHTVDVYTQLDKELGANEFIIDVIIDNGGTHDVTVDGASVSVVGKGFSAVASWQAADGYDVTRIVIDGVSYAGLPGCTAQGGSYTFNNVDKGHRVVVYTTKHVDKDPVYYGISVLPYGDPNGVELNAAAGGMSGKTLVAVPEDSEAVATWQAKAGWKIDKVTRNGNIMSDEDVAAGMTDGFKFKVNADNNFVVYISEVKRVDESFYTVTTQISNGWISNGASVQKGENFDVSWLPNNGYKFDSVTIETELVDENGGKTIESVTYRAPDFTDSAYPLTSIQGNTTVKVECVADPSAVHSYQISTEATNGSIIGGGTAVAGTDKVLSWAPAEGCTVTSIELYKVDEDGNILEEVDISTAANNTWTITGIADNYLMVLVCENTQHSDDDFFYDINTSVTNGTINGPFLNLRKTGGALVKWMPNDGYHVKEVILDGTRLTSIPASYELEVLVEGEDHTVEVICEKDEPIVIEPGDVTHTVSTFIYDGSGYITPTTTVKEGGSFTVQWKADPVNQHYKVDRVYVDGINIPTPANNLITLTDIKADHSVEVYLVENLVNVEVSYEGSGDVVKSGTVYYSENFGVVQGVANVDDGYKLEKVYLNNKLLQPGEILVDYLPDPDLELPIEQNQPQSRMRKALKSLAGLFNMFAITAEAAPGDEVDTPENRARCVDPATGLQNVFFFKNVTETQNVRYVFTDENGATDYAPYQVSVELVGGRGERDVAVNVAPGAGTDIGWWLDEGYYVDHIGILSDGRETDINSVDTATYTPNPGGVPAPGDRNQANKDKVSLANVQANTVVKVYLKRGEAPTTLNDFSLDIKVVGPGSGDPAITVEGNGYGLAAGDHTAIWNVGTHKVTMVKVDGADRTDLIGKDRTTITMNEDDELRDHVVVVYLDGQVLPGLEKSAGNEGAKVGETVPYTITVWNDTDQAIWKNVTLSDTIPEGLAVDTASAKLYRLAADGSKTPVTDKPISYDAATRVLSVNVGDISKTDKFELSFNATVEVGADTKDIGNSVSAIGKLAGSEDPVEKTTDPVYPGGKESVLPSDPDPKVTKKVVNDRAGAVNTRVGDSLTYTIDVWNEKDGSLWKNVKLQDVLPNGLSMVDGSLKLLEVLGTGTVEAGADVSVQFDAVNNTITATLGDIDSVKHYRIVFTVNVMAAAVDADIGNIAIANGTSPEKKPVSVETDPVYPVGDEVLAAAPVIKITKAVRNLDRTGEQSQIGDTLEYTITVRNERDESTWKNAVLRDRIPDALEIDPNSIILRSDSGDTALDPSVYNAESRLLSVLLGDINGGESYQVVFNAKVTGSPLENDIGNYSWVNGKDPSLPGGKDPVPGIEEDSKPGDPYFPPEDEDDDWVDEGGYTTEKVYPDEKDRPLPPGAKVNKSSRNITNPLGSTEIGDIVEYEIEISNTQRGSVWKTISLEDILPDVLSPELDGFSLIYPDGTVEDLDINEHYNQRTNVITIELPDMYFGDTYWLRYRTFVNDIAAQPSESPLITNLVRVSGTAPDGTPVVVEDENSIPYPIQEVIDPVIIRPLPKTGDDANIALYVCVMLASAALCGTAVFVGRRKGKKED